MIQQLVMYEDELQHINRICEILHRDSNAKAVLVIDKNGQAIAQAGDTQQLDVTSLSSLTAGNVAATGGMALLIGEKEFPTLSHEGERESIHICIIGRVLLVVVFDERSSLGLVKLRVKQAGRELALIFEEVARLTAARKAADESMFAEITDEDIDSLFN